MDTAPAQSDTKMRITAAAIAIAILAIAVSYRIATTQSAPTVAIINTTTETAVIDSDSDGVADWEEQLFGSNPVDAASVPTTTTATLLDTASSSSATEAVARTLLQQYLSNTQGGTVPLKDPTALGIAIANSISVPTSYRIYKTSDIRIVGNTVENRLNYKTKLEQVFIPMQSTTEPEIGIYGRATTGDAAAEQELRVVIDIYSNVAATAAVAPVPLEAATVHLRAVNALSYYSGVLNNLLAQKDDPIASLVVLGAYNEAEQEMFTSFDALKRYLAQSTSL